MRAGRDGRTPSRATVSRRCSARATKGSRTCMTSRPPIIPATIAGRPRRGSTCEIISGTFSDTRSSRGCARSTRTPLSWALRPTTGSCGFTMLTTTELADKIRAGGRITAGEALELYQHAPLPLLGELADGIRRRKHPEGIVTYIIDRNVNYTNVCVARCNFCAFYRPVGSSEGYLLRFEDGFKKIYETIALGGVQLLLQGGHNPDLPIESYQDLFRPGKQRYPSFKLHALSPPEVIHLTRMSRLTVPQVIDRLMAAGLDSIPGGGAEILV